MDAHLKECLIRDAKNIVKLAGIKRLIEYKAYASECGCMGARDGDPFCPCRMAFLLEENLLEIINEINPAAALTLMRRRIIKAFK